MRKNFGPQTWIYPMPVLIIGTYDENGNPDAMNAAWGGTFDYNQIIISLSAHQTTENIKRNRAFTVSFANKDTVTASDYVGLVSFKKEPQKVAKAGLIVEKASQVNAPLFINYPLTLECEVVDIINEGEGGGNVIAKIVNVSADEKVLSNGQVDFKKLGIITYDPISHKYVALGDEVADAFKEGLKIK